MRRNFQIAIGLLWLAPVVMFLQYWLVWDRLPQSVANHFAANGQPNGWMSRAAAVAFPLIPVLIVLLMATVCWVRIPEPHAGSWAILGLVSVLPVALIAINGQIITFNLGGTPIHGLTIKGLTIMGLPIMGLLIVLATLAAVLVCVLVFLSAKRGGPLPLADVVAEQVHGSRVWTLLLLGPLLVLTFVVLRIPDRGLRVVFVPRFWFSWSRAQRLGRAFTTALPTAVLKFAPWAFACVRFPRNRSAATSPVRGIGRVVMAFEAGARIGPTCGGIPAFASRRQGEAYSSDTLSRSD